MAVGVDDVEVVGIVARVETGSAALGQAVEIGQQGHVLGQSGRTPAAAGAYGLLRQRHRRPQLRRRRRRRRRKQRKQKQNRNVCQNRAITWSSSSIGSRKKKVAFFFFFFFTGELGGPSSASPKTQFRLAAGSLP